MAKGVCPKCGVVKPLTRHHILPKRLFGSQGNRDIFLLCRECHSELELLIPLRTKKEDIFYYQIVFKFLNGGKYHDR